MTDASLPRIRRAPLPDDAVLVLRGDDLGAFATGRHQAEAFRRRYPAWARWGLSAFFARNAAEVDDLAGDRLERFPLLACYRVADLRAAGFEVWPTFRTPHVTIAFGGDLDERLAALLATPHDTLSNPYHQTDG
ncbi:MAG: hypothetical protein ACT4QG_15455 [Sporichthyaceae bacterium]